MDRGYDLCINIDVDDEPSHVGAALLKVIDDLRVERGLPRRHKDTYRPVVRENCELPCAVPHVMSLPMPPENAKQSEHTLSSPALAAAHVRGVPVEDVDDYVAHRFEQEVKGAIGRRQQVHEDELLAENDLGRRILELRRQQEDLIDVVWLATSPSQLKTLWSKVGELLGDQPTRLERDALEIEPVNE